MESTFDKTLNGIIINVKTTFYYETDEVDKNYIFLFLNPYPRSTSILKIPNIHCLQNNFAAVALSPTVNVERLNTFHQKKAGFLNLFQTFTVILRFIK